MDTSANWDEPSKDVRESRSGWGNQHNSGKWKAGHALFFPATSIYLRYVWYTVYYMFISGLFFPLIYPGPKPMETWGGEDVSMGNSWDQEEEVEIGMWSNNQQDNRSHDQNIWNYKSKGPNKVCRIKQQTLLKRAKIHPTMLIQKNHLFLSF